MTGPSRRDAHHLHVPRVVGVEGRVTVRGRLRLVLGKVGAGHRVDVSVSRVGVPRHGDILQQPTAGVAGSDRGK
jgi:hypothetical protein